MPQFSHQNDVWLNHVSGKFFNPLTVSHPKSPEIHDYTKSFDIYDERSQILILYFVHKVFVHFLKGMNGPIWPRSWHNSYRFYRIRYQNCIFDRKWPFYMRKIRLRKSSQGEDLAWRLPKLLKPHITAKSANLWVLVGFQHRLGEHLKTDFWDILIFQSSKNTYLTCTCIFIMF